MNYDLFKFTHEKAKQAEELAPILGITIEKTGKDTFTLRHPNNKKVGPLDFILECLCIAVADRGAQVMKLNVQNYPDPIDRILKYTPARMLTRIAKVQANPDKE